MGIDDLSEARGAAPCTTIEHIRLVLLDCLEQLDDLNAQVAAAHLAACLDVLEQNAKPD